MEKNYIITSEQYANLKSAWKTLAAEKRITPEDVIIYNLLRGKPLKNGFIAVQRESKIQGLDAWYAYNLACFNAGWMLPDRRPAMLPDNAKRYAERFKDRFGIDMPEGLFDKLQELKNV